MMNMEDGIIAYRGSYPELQQIYLPMVIHIITE